MLKRCLHDQNMPIDVRAAPHLCRSTRRIDSATVAVPLVPPIDQWGYIPFPVQRLIPHSLSRRVRDLLNGDLGAHRDLPIDADEKPQPPAHVPAPAPRAVYSRDNAQRAWERRRADLQDIAGVADILNQIDTRAKELQQRTATILAAESNDRHSLTSHSLQRTTVSQTPSRKVRQNQSPMLPNLLDR